MKFKGKGCAGHLSTHTRNGVLAEELITEVQRNPALFDKSHLLYKNAIKKQDIWVGIRRALGISGKEKP